VAYHSYHLLNRPAVLSRCRFFISFFQTPAGCDGEADELATQIRKCGYSEEMDLLWSILPDEQIVAIKGKGEMGTQIVNR
jgi:hypothetical protein